MKRTFVFTTTSGAEGRVTWRDGALSIAAEPAVRDEIESTLRKGSGVGYAPQLGGAFLGFDPADVRHVELGLASLQYGRGAVLVRGSLRREGSGLAKALRNLPAGALLLPLAHGRAAFFAQLFKGAGHKYIKRIPTGKFTKTGKPRYRYFYHVAHGGGVATHEHMIQGAGFRADGGHWHIDLADGDKLTVRHDETGETRTMTRAELAAKLAHEHREAMGKHEAERATKHAAMVEEARQYGSDAQRKRLGLPTRGEEEAKRAAKERPTPGKPASMRGVTSNTAQEVYESSGARDAAKGIADGTITAADLHERFEASGNHRKYGRDDIDYDDWYPSWMKQLARSYTRDELVRMLGKTGNEAARAVSSHHAAIARTTGMQSQSQRRAQTGNLARGLGDRAIAIRGALEIHDLFPEHAKAAPVSPAPAPAPKLSKGTSPLLKALITAFGASRAIPDFIGEALYSSLQKAAGHKYIRRVPTGNPKRPWRYFYRTVGGKGLGHHEEMVEGASFRLKDAGQEGHFHITQDHGDGYITIKHDETGTEHKVHKDALAAMLHNEHAEVRKQDEATAAAKREKAKAQAAKDLAEAKQSGTPKHVAAAKKRAEKLGVKVEEEGKSTPQERTTKEATAPKTKTVRFKNATIEPGEFHKDRDGLWVAVESKVKRMTAADREFEEDAGDPHFADARSVGTVKLRQATGEEEAKLKAWEADVAALSRDAKLHENITGWEPLPVSDETRREAIPAIKLIKDRVDSYHANKALIDRATSIEPKQVSDADLVALARINSERMARRIASLPEGFEKTRSEREKASMDASYHLAETAPGRFRTMHESTLISGAKQDKKAAETHDPKVLRRAVDGDVNAIAEVVKRHGVDIGGGESAEGEKWKVPEGAERIDPVSYRQVGGVTIFVDRKAGKVYSHKTVGYDDYRSIVQVAGLTPENEAAIARAKDARGKKPPPAPRAGVGGQAKAEIPKGAAPGAPAEYKAHIDIAHMTGADGKPAHLWWRTDKKWTDDHGRVFDSLKDAADKLGVPVDDLRDAPSHAQDGTPNIHVASGTSMRSSAFHQGGRPKWWLRNTANASGGFVDIRETPGDQPFSGRLNLPPGQYTLGVGKGGDAIRRPFTVHADGTSSLGHVPVGKGRAGEIRGKGMQKASPL